MIEFHIKEKTRSLNESFRGDWRPRAAVAKRQRTKAMQACPKWPGGPLLVVRLTRVSPGTLDGDAVPAACKHIRDGLAARLRIDDASPLVAWEYHQAKGEAEVVAQIWKAGEDAPPMPVGRQVEKKRGMAAPNKGRGRAKPCGCLRSLGACQHDRPGKMSADAGKRHRCNTSGCRNLRPCAVHDGAKAWALGMAAPAYTPPEAERRAMLAAQEAEATFAPGPETCRVPECTEARVAHGYCATHALQGLP